MSEVSIVLPFKNASATLGRAILSLQNQTLEDWELIAVDDQSTDDSAILLEQFASVDPRIKQVKNRNPGIANALNLGIRNARSPYLARMDADDASHPERLERQASFLNKNKAIGLVASQVNYCGNRAQNIGYATYVDWTNELLDRDCLRANRFVESPVAHPSVMFRQVLVPGNSGPYLNGDFPEDYELWLRWMENGVQMTKIGMPLLDWYDSPDRLSRSDSRYGVDAFYRIKAKYLAQWLKKESHHHRPVWIWGAGRITRKRAEFLNHHAIAFAGFIDIDLKKTGTRIQGLPVVLPEALPLETDPFVISYVANRGARADIRCALRDMGLVEERDFILAA